MGVGGQDREVSPDRREVGVLDGDIAFNGNPRFSTGGEDKHVRFVFLQPSIGIFKEASEPALLIGFTIDARHRQVGKLLSENDIETFSLILGASEVKEFLVGFSGVNGCQKLMSETGNRAGEDLAAPGLIPPLMGKDPNVRIIRLANRPINLTALSGTPASARTIAPVRRRGGRLE